MLRNETWPRLGWRGPVPDRDRECRTQAFNEFNNVVGQASLWSDMAYVWQVNDRIGLVSISGAPESDEWRNNVNYCFDENSRLRRLYATFIVLVDPGFSSIETREYDKTGQMKARDQWYEASDSDRRLSEPHPTPSNTNRWQHCPCTLTPRN
jgi:hypothetical protein